MADETSISGTKTVEASSVNDDDAYVPMVCDKPLEFESDEERFAAFTEMIIEATKKFKYKKFKDISYFDVQAICGTDARWNIFKSSGPKKEAFTKYYEERVAILKKEVDRLQRKKEAEAKAKRDMHYAAALINQTTGCDMVQRLINLGTDPNCTLPPGPRQSKNGKTAAYIAAKHGHLRTLELLHRLGADVNKPKDNGCTPIYVAAEHNQSEAIALLYRLGADVSKSKPFDGFFPMLIATQFHNLNCVIALYEAGADISQKNFQGQTPLIMAIQKEDKPIERFLRSKGATLGTEDMDLHTTEDIIEWLKRLALLPSMFPVFLHNIRTFKVTPEMIFDADDPQTMSKMLNPELNESWANAFFKLFLYQAASQRTRALQKELHAAAMAMSDEANQNDKLDESSDTGPASNQPLIQESTLADAKHIEGLNNAIKDMADSAFKQGGLDKSLHKDE